MKRVIGKHGETRSGVTTVALKRGDTTIVLKGVPAQICDNCGEGYVDEEIAARLLSIAEEAVHSGVQVMCATTSRSSAPGR